MSPFSVLPYKDALKEQLIHFTLLTERWTLATSVHVSACCPVTHAHPHTHNVDGTLYLVKCLQCHTHPLRVLLCIIEEEAVKPPCMPGCRFNIC